MVSILPKRKGSIRPQYPVYGWARNRFRNRNRRFHPHDSGTGSKPGTEQESEQNRNSFTAPELTEAYGVNFLAQGEARVVLDPGFEPGALPLGP